MINNSLNRAAPAVPVGQRVKQGQTRLNNDIVDAERMSMGLGLSADNARSALKDQLPARQANKSQAANVMLNTQGTARPQAIPAPARDMEELPPMFESVDPIEQLTTNIRLEELLSSIPLQQLHTKNQLTEYFVNRNLQNEAAGKQAQAVGALRRLLRS